MRLLSSLCVVIGIVVVCGQISAQDKQSTKRHRNNDDVPPPVILSPIQKAKERDSGIARELMLALVNSHRKENKLLELKVSKVLNLAAQDHAENMARQTKMSHTLDGKSLGDRLDIVGYGDKTKGGTYGENVHAWPDDTMDVRVVLIPMFDGWKKSKGHNENMLRKEFTEIGFGIARGKDGYWYGCQVFGVVGR